MRKRFPGDDLWGGIEESALEGRCYQMGLGNRLGESEVCDFYVEIVVDHNVGWVKVQV